MRSFRALTFVKCTGSSRGAAAGLPSDAELSWRPAAESPGGSSKSGTMISLPAARSRELNLRFRSSVRRLPHFAIDVAWCRIRET